MASKEKTKSETVSKGATAKQTKETKAEEHIKFGAEVGKILHLMIHSLYANKEIFLRELISNASDACDKLRYLSITNPELTKNDPEFKIRITADKEKRTLTITDNGIGMNRDDLIENIGTIASSGTQSFLEKLTGDNNKDLQLIGQFGVGFYSGFMVAEEMEVISHKAGEKESWIWKSKGEGEYTIKQLETYAFNRGTSVTLHLKSGEDDFLDKFRISNIVKTYSDHIAFPIEFMMLEEHDDDIKLKKENRVTNGSGREENVDIDDEINEGMIDVKATEIEVLNTASAIWMRPKSEVTEEQHNEFYKQISHLYDKPWHIMHNKNEGVVEFTNLLYIPSSKPFDLFSQERKSKLKLYIKRVYIGSENIDLVPTYLRFLQGIVDSEDLPLNISRETLQHSHSLEKIRKAITKKVINELSTKMEKEYDNYLQFWNNFGAVLKEGLCEISPTKEEKEKLLEICLFYSSLQNKLISLAEYITNMKEGQNTIFYLNSDSIEKAKNSPQLEGFIKHGVDVLLFTDPVDDFWVSMVHNFKDKEIKSVTRSGNELSKIINPKKAEDAESEGEGEEKDKDKKIAETEELNDQNKELINHFKDILKDVVMDVKSSEKLVDSPVCLAAAEGAMDIRMERYFKEQRGFNPKFTRILEINLNHPIIAKIRDEINKDDKNLANELILILFDQACIIEGEQVTDMVAFTKRINHLLEKI